jgi:hypothetical protein
MLGQASDDPTHDAVKPSSGESTLPGPRVGRSEFELYHCRDSVQKAVSNAVDVVSG